MISMSPKNSAHILIYYYLFLLLAFLLPLYERAVPLVVILIVVNWSVEGRFTWKFHQCLHNKRSLFILSFSLLFLLYAFSLVYSDNLRMGALELQTELSLLVFPVIFATIDREAFAGEKAGHIFLAFFAGCLLSSLVLLGDASFRYIESLNPNEFIYTKLAAGKHPSYFSMYISLTIAIVINYILGRWGSLTYNLRVMLILLLVYLSFIVLLLCSKAGIIALIIVFLVFIAYSFRRKALTVPGVIISILAVTFTVTAFYLFPPTMGRLGRAIGALHHYENIESDNTESTAERILIWKSAFEACMEKPLTGHGIGDVKEDLSVIYQKNQVQQAFRLNLNAHNQYLQTFLAIGLPGMLILILSLVLPFILSARRKNVLFAVFLLIIGSNFLFESMLCRQAGVVFYAFFNVFFIYTSEAPIPSPRQ